LSFQESLQLGILLGDLYMRERGRQRERERGEERRRKERPLTLYGEIFFCRGIRLAIYLSKGIIKL